MKATKLSGLVLAVFVSLCLIFACGCRASENEQEMSANSTLTLDMLNQSGMVKVSEFEGAYRLEILGSITAINGRTLSLSEDCWLLSVYVHSSAAVSAFSGIDDTLSPPRVKVRDADWSEAAVGRRVLLTGRYKPGYIFRVEDLILDYP